jgi:hypothetical protein
VLLVPKMSNLPDLQKSSDVSDEGGVSINYSNSNSNSLSKLVCGVDASTSRYTRGSSTSRTRREHAVCRNNTPMQARQHTVFITAE